MESSGADTVETAAAILQALSLPLRLRIVLYVLEHEATAGDIGARLGASSPTMSHHLRHLRVAGVLQRRRDGNHVLYQAAPLVGELVRGAMACADAARRPRSAIQEDHRTGRFPALPHH
jgi:DNA-binding transcriptional ArsR family regulator